MDVKILHEMLKEIKDDQKDIKDSQNEMKKDLSIMKEDVAVHIYRTDLLESEIKEQKKSNKEGFEKVEEDFKPVYKHINKVNGALGFIGGLSVLLGILKMFNLF